MIDFISIVIGAGIVLLAGGIGYLYWRYWGNGSILDFVSEEEAPNGDFKIVKRVKEANQRIAVVETNGETWIYANGDVMFSTTEDENMYAEAIVHLPMAAAPVKEKVLIIGGGGGNTTREVLKYPEVKEITVVDIDSVMFDFGENLTSLVQFNEGSLNNPKVKTVVEDGRKFIENSTKKWDVIIIDLPEPTLKEKELSKLFSLEFYTLLKGKLEPIGVINITCPSFGWIPDYMWSIQATLKAAGFYVLPYHLDIMADWEGDYGFCIATNYPLVPESLVIKAPTTYMNKERVEDMLKFSYNQLKFKEKNKIQTDKNLILAEILDERWD